MPYLSLKKADLPFLLVLAGFAFLLLYDLPFSPGPSYDEGAHLHVVKNFALNGVYADYSIEGNRPFGPSVGTGPTVLLPIALLYKLFGVSLVTGRLVMVAYSFAMLIAAYGLGSWLVDRRFGLVTVLLMFLTPAQGMAYFARSVMGEVACLAILLIAIWLWLTTESKQLARLAVVGLMFGLSSITKNQFAMSILPAMFLCWMADLFWYRQHRWTYYVIPGAIAGVVYFGWVYLILFSGADAASNMEALQVTSSYALFVWNVGDAVRFLISAGLYVYLLPFSVLYGLYLSKDRTKEAQKWGMITIFTCTAIFFFISSLGWDRYGFLAAGLGALLVARFLYALTGGFRLDWEELRGKWSLRTVIRWGAMLLLVVFLGVSVYRYIQYWAGPSMHDTYSVTAYLDANAPVDSVIETFEQELQVLTNHRYHYPPHTVDAELNRQTLYGIPEGGVSIQEQYDFRDYVDADYVVIGPIGEASRFYTQERLTDYELIYEVGFYQVYQQQSTVR